MLKVKHLKEYLAMCPDDMEIVGTNCEPIIHLVNTKDKIVLSDEKPIGYHKCGEYVYPETTQGLEQYKGICTNCNENVFGFEIIQI